MNNFSPAQVLKVRFKFRKQKLSSKRSLFKLSNLQENTSGFAVYKQTGSASEHEPQRHQSFKFHMAHQVFSRETKSFPVTQRTQTDISHLISNQRTNTMKQGEEGQPQPNAMIKRFQDPTCCAGELWILQTAHNTQNELLSHPHTQQVLL